MQYLYWRVATGLNDKVEISFMLVGHTKFAPDWCFGLLKQKFRRTKVGCLDDIVRVVNDSAKVNYAELVGREDGTVLVPQYDWAEYFTPFFKRQGFKGIKSLHHLVFSRTTPGYVVVREYNDSPEKKLKILSDEYLHWVPSSSELPPVIDPPGLSQERKEYLFREFCPPHCRDIVCPDPNISNSTPTVPPTQPSLPTPSTLSPSHPCSPTPLSQPPAQKRRRRAH